MDSDDDKSSNKSVQVKSPSKPKRDFNASKFPSRRIPKSIFKRTLEIMENPNDEFWFNKNTSCSITIDQELHMPDRHLDSFYKLDLARQCLLRRDWALLAKLLASNTMGDTQVQKSSFSVMESYASILFAEMDPKLLTALNQITATNRSLVSSKSMANESTHN